MKPTFKQLAIEFLTSPKEAIKDYKESQRLIIESEKTEWVLLSNTKPCHMSSSRLRRFTHLTKKYGHQELHEYSKQLRKTIDQ